MNSSHLNVFPQSADINELSFFHSKSFWQLLDLQNQTKFSKDFLGGKNINNGLYAIKDLEVTSDYATDRRSSKRQVNSAEDLHRQNDFPQSMYPKRFTPDGKVRSASSFYPRFSEKPNVTTHVNQATIPTTPHRRIESHSRKNGSGGPTSGIVQSATPQKRLYLHIPKQQENNSHNGAPRGTSIPHVLPAVRVNNSSPEIVTRTTRPAFRGPQNAGGYSVTLYGDVTRPTKQRFNQRQISRTNNLSPRLVSRGTSPITPAEIDYTTNMPRNYRNSHSSREILVGSDNESESYSSSQSSFNSNVQSVNSDWSVERGMREEMPRRRSAVVSLASLNALHGSRLNESIYKVHKRKNFYENVPSIQFLRKSLEELKILENDAGENSPEYATVKSETETASTTQRAQDSLSGSAKSAASSVSETKSNYEEADNEKETARTSGSSTSLDSSPSSNDCVNKNNSIDSNETEVVKELTQVFNHHHPEQKSPSLTQLWWAQKRMKFERKQTVFINGKERTFYGY